MPSRPREKAEPPLVDLGDTSVRWAFDGAALRVTRRPTFLGVLPALLALAGVLAIAWTAVRSGDVILGAFFGFFALFPLVFVWLRGTERFDMRVARDGVTWARTKPRAFSGEWAAGSVSAVRVRRGPKPARSVFRSVHVEARHGDRWVELAQGYRKRRAQQYAEAWARAVGAPEVTALAQE